MILQEPKVGERNSRNTNHRSRVSTFLSAPGDSVEIKSGRGDIYNVVNSCKEKTHLPTHFPELCQPSRSESYFFWTSTISLQSHFQKKPWRMNGWNPKKISSLKRKKNHHLPTKPINLHSYDLPSPRDRYLHIQAAGYCNPNVLNEQNMACVLSLANCPVMVGHVGKKLGKSSWKTTKGDTDLCDKKMEKTHPGINFYRLHCCTKKGRKRKGKFFAV